MTDISTKKKVNVSELEPDAFIEEEKEEDNETDVSKEDKKDIPLL